MKKCRYADQYKAKHPPRCNGGNPCDACQKKWDARTIKPPKITSNFAILDVKVGRAALAKLVKKKFMRVPIFIDGYINDVHSRDDGVSIEFSVDVVRLTPMLAETRAPFDYEKPEVRAKALRKGLAELAKQRGLPVLDPAE